MRPFISAWMLISCSLFIFSGTAGAHPHKLGKMDHGPSLESYQIDPDFSINHLARDWPNRNIALANKGRNDKRVRSKKPDERNKSPKIQKIDRPLGQLQKQKAQEK